MKLHQRRITTIHSGITSKEVIMKLFTKTMLAAAAVLAFTSPAQAIVDFDISNNVGKQLVFDGAGNFNFMDEVANSNDDFRITGQTGGTNSLLGLNGDIDGTFSFADPMGATSVAISNPVGATFTIKDGAGVVLTSDITLFTLSELGGIFAGITGEILVSNVSYAGANADLLTLASVPGAVGGITFQVSGGADLDSLFANAHDYSYSGTFTPVPEPGTMLLMGSGLLGLGLWRKFKK
jgi:hypothetical protein